jgi:hypothetical protein
MARVARESAGHMDSAADHGGSPPLGSPCVTTRRIGGASRQSTSELVHIDILVPLVMRQAQLPREEGLAQQWRQRGPQ